MSDKSSTKLNPVLLIVVGVLVLAAVGVGLAMMGGSSNEEENTTDKTGSEARGKKSSRSPGSSDLESERNSRKSEGVREGSRPDQGAGVARFDVADVDQMFVQVSVSAREELKLLREKHATEYDDPEERRAFGVKLSQITDPQERQRALRERTEAMRRARATSDAAKSIEDREREKQLIVLMQVQNLWRMSEFLSKNNSLSAEAADFETGLVEWVQNSGEMNNDEFHSSFNALRDQLNNLRRRNTQNVHPGATRANLPSNRPERQGQR